MHTHAQLQVGPHTGYDDVDIAGHRMGWGCDDVDSSERTSTEHVMSSTLEGRITHNWSNHQETAECFVGRVGK